FVDAGVTACTILVARRDLVKDLADQLAIIVDVTADEPACMNCTQRIGMRQSTLGNRDQLFSFRTDEIRLRLSGLDALMGEQRFEQRTTQRTALVVISLQVFTCYTMSHDCVLVIRL